jgi:hypothetical protein
MSKLLMTAFQLPQDSIVDLYNSLLIDQAQSQVLKEDLLQVLNSFYYDDDLSGVGGQPKITLSNIQIHAKSATSSIGTSKRIQVARVIVKKLAERKLKPVNVFRMA